MYILCMTFGASPSQVSIIRRQIATTRIHVNDISNRDTHSFMIMYNANDMTTGRNKSVL